MKYTIEIELRPSSNSAYPFEVVTNSIVRLFDDIEEAHKYARIKEEEIIKELNEQISRNISAVYYESLTK